MIPTPRYFCTVPGCAGDHVSKWERCPMSEGQFAIRLVIVMLVLVAVCAGLSAAHAGVGSGMVGQLMNPGDPAPGSTPLLPDSITTESGQSLLTENDIQIVEE